jgi:hypothetical protein
MFGSQCNWMLFVALAEEGTGIVTMKAGSSDLAVVHFMIF